MSSPDEGRGRGADWPRERARLVALAALACVPLLILAMSPELLRGRNIIEQVDVYNVYWKTALQVRNGLVPYRDFPLEYPLASLAPMLPPIALTTGRLAYEALFILECLALNAALIWLVAREVERDDGPAAVRSRLIWYGAAYAPLSRMIVSRIDLAPTILAFWAASLWFRGRTGRAGALAAAGALMKIFPGFVAFPGALWELSSRGGRRARGAVSFALVLGLGLAGWWAVGGRGAVESLAYHAERGLELESLYAAALALIGRRAGWVQTVSLDHGSFNLVGPWSAELSKLSGLVQLGALAITLAAFARAGFRSGMRATLGVLIATVITAKVLSPQYYIWILPFVVALGGRVGRRARWLYVIICVLTLIECPFCFDAVKRLETPAVLLVNARNALTLALWWVVTFGTEEEATGPAEV